MNPPFSEGRVQSHILHAFGLLRDGGRLVAILPASYKGKNFVGKCASIEYSDIFKNEFDKTSIDTICVKIVK
jgi:16S rRNA G1207 methylase RsmC